ncbi:glutathione-disulfide reductase [Indioceanicola profundi]|uniref:glutathione-disulfide reductase n=1 Tax=Indioceanicola profundi TaxID=2220096 RepID=UPI000E6ACFE3|nr:glutathione-disulfide reductase [Indioceanicola profundi]
MARYDYDLFVIGAGSGGVRAARIAGQYGARVAVAEERYFGGTCVNVGCVPKKFLVFGASYAHDFEDAAGYGWSVGERSFDWQTLIANKDREIQRLNGIYRRLLEGAGVTIFEGRARLGEEPHSVVVNGQTVTAERILIATGGWPELPSEPGAKEYGITSNEVFHLDRFPRRVIIAGGGYIATEFASIFNGLGAEVTQLYRGHQILRGFDRDVREFVSEELVKTGINIRYNTIISRIEKAGDCLMASLSDERQLEVDAVIYAIGRVPMSRGLGLEEAGVEMDKGGAIKVNDQYQTSVPHIYALGDVTNRVNLTPVALAEGHVLADRLFGGREERDVNYDNIPTAVFSIPPVATCGLTEEEARARFGNVDVYRSNFKPMRHTLSGRDQRTMMKLVVERESQRVVGVHMVGADTPEMIQGIAVAMNAGATKQVFDRTIGLHPTAAEEFVTMRTKAPEPAGDED